MSTEEKNAVGPAQPNHGLAGQPAPAALPRAAPQVGNLTGTSPQVLPATSAAVEEKLPPSATGDGSQRRDSTTDPASPAAATPPPSLSARGTAASSLAKPKGVDPVSRPPTGGTEVQNTGGIGVQVVAGSIGSFFPPPEKKPFVDPTEELPSRPLGIDPFRLQIDEQILSALDSYRVALLTSFDHDTCLAAAAALIQHERFTAYKKRTLVLTRTDNRERIDLSIDLFTRPEYLEKREEKEIVLVEVSSRGNAFLDSLNITERIHATKISENLAARNTFILVAARCDLLKLEPEQRLQGFSFTHWPVPFLLPRLQRHFEGERAKQIEELLHRQLHGGLWRDLAEMYQEVSGRLQSSVAEFEEALSMSERGDPSRLRAHARETTPLAKLAGENELRRMVLYTAVYFPDLTPHDFDWMVHLMVGDRTLPVDVESQVVTDHGEVRIRKERVERRMAEIWQAAPDAVLADCLLETASLRDRTHTIEFTAPHRRREVRAVLETRFPMFLTATFSRLQDAGVLFLPRVSAAIVENLIRLSVERTLIDPGYYGTRWLVDFVASLRSDTDAEIDGEDPSELLLELLAKLRDDLRKRHICGRLAQLIREMLRHDRLRPTVRGFFSALVGERRHEVAPDILLELVKRLRFAPQFDGFYWLRRLIDEAPDELEQRAYLCLLDLAAESGARIFKVIDEVRAWLPAESSRISSRYALRFIADYSHFSLSSVPAESYGAWPSRCALIAACPRDGEQLRSRLEMLAGWLLDPGVPDAIDAKDPPTADVYLGFVGDLLEEFLLVLEGTDPGNAHPDARLLGDALVSAFAGALGRPRRAQLARYWHDKRGTHHQQALETPLVPAARAKERRWLLARWQILTTLSRRLDEAATRLAATRTEIGP